MNAKRASLPQKSTAYPIHIVPNTVDALAYLARLIIERHKQELPDLSRVIILTPEMFIGRRLRQQLSLTARDAGCSALLGPTVNTLRSWVESSVSLDIPIMSATARELMLIESLYQHVSLFGATNPWHLGGYLISLFDELTLHRIDLPRDLDDFIRLLESGYGLDSVAVSAFTREASLIHTLWRAWHQQQLEEGMIDHHAAYLAKLAASRQSVSATDTFYLLGFTSLLACEVEWVQQLIYADQLSMIVQADLDPRHSAVEDNTSSIVANLIASIDPPPLIIPGVKDTYSEFLDEVYASRSNRDMDSVMDLPQRALQFARACPHSPLDDRFYIFEAFDAEQEAHAIDIQIRRWLLEGKQRIGVISEDRRLARRLRAILERANINLQDPAGWALSTTSAASTLERWLETLEEDFDHQPLLDLLKSSYILPDQTLASRLRSVYRLEQDIILHENIARGLDRYRRHIVYRRNRLHWSSVDGNHVNALLDRLEYAAEPLRPFIAAREFAPARVITAFTESLQRLGIIDTFQHDEAGRRLLEVIRLMRQSLRNRRIKISWNDFRQWLGQTLEHANFSPPQAAGKVVLLNLEQSNLQRFDAVIIASAIDKHLPGQKPHNPFFNDAVKRDLGLPGYRESVARQFYHFRRILECAPVVLVTLQRTQGGEALIPSPWVAILQAFHEVGYKRKPGDNGLAELVEHPATVICRTDTCDLPVRHNFPAPAVIANLIPHTFSATMYQDLINCPYQFYASHCLALKPTEEIREAMEKADYGNRVHEILQLFHGDSPDAFSQPLNSQTRDAAIKKLCDLSHQRFARDLEDNIIHRGWLKQWLTSIPAYVDWQIERQGEWQIAAVETSVINDKFADNIAIKGRLDRIDENARGKAILDYKTGKAPRSHETESGEAVQLPFYAMLTPAPVVQVEYLKFGPDKVKSESQLDGPELQSLTEKNADRLRVIVEAMTAGKPLPAWGDEKTCSYCQVQGVCRKQAWTTLQKEKAT